MGQRTHHRLDIEKPLQPSLRDGHIIRSEDQHRDEQMFKIVACLAALRESVIRENQDVRVGDSLDEERSSGLSLACIISAKVLYSSCVCLACYS